MVKFAAFLKEVPPRFRHNFYCLNAEGRKGIKYREVRVLSWTPRAALRVPKC